MLDAYKMQGTTWFDYVRLLYSRTAAAFGVFAHNELRRQVTDRRIAFRVSSSCSSETGFAFLCTPSTTNGCSRKERTYSTAVGESMRALLGQDTRTLCVCVSIFNKGGINTRASFRTSTSTFNQRTSPRLELKLGKQVPSTTPVLPPASPRGCNKPTFVFDVGFTNYFSRVFNHPASLCYPPDAAAIRRGCILAVDYNSTFVCIARTHYLPNTRLTEGNSRTPSDS